MSYKTRRGITASSGRKIKVLWAERVHDSMGMLAMNVSRALRAREEWRVLEVGERLIKPVENSYKQVSELR
jgi:hypothetical protein